MSKIKELNSLLEQTLEKANNKKLEKINKEATLKKTDAAHHLRLKEYELKNTKVQIEKY